MSSEPRVSIVIANYNYGRYLAQAVDSLLSQEFQELEVIIVDDASTDESTQVLSRYAAVSRVRIVKHANNVGADRSWNEGLRLARGEFVGILDADDYCLRTDAVARQVAVFEAHPMVGFVYSASKAIDEEDALLCLIQPWAADYVRSGLDEFADLILECYVRHSGALVRRSAHAAVGEYDETIPASSDWYRLLLLATRFDVAYIAEPLYAYRVHRKSMTAGWSPRDQSQQDVLTVEKAFAALPATAPPVLRRLRPVAMRRSLLGGVAAARMFGWTRRGWQSVMDAVRQSPVVLIAPEFYDAVARLLLITLIGHRRYKRLAALRPMRRRGPVQPAS